MKTFRRLLGLALSAVDRSHLSALHCRLRDKPVRANQAVGMVPKLFKLAVARGMTPISVNLFSLAPCHVIVPRPRFPGGGGSGGRDRCLEGAAQGQVAADPAAGSPVLSRLRALAARDRRSGLAGLSPVALKKRLAKSGPWLLSLCQALFEGPSPDRAGLEVSAVDATTVKEPGKTGSLWRVHYSMRLPSLVCDHFVVTGTEGVGTGESFRRFPVAAGDHLIGDRGYSTASGIAHVAASGGRVMVRANTGSLRFVLADGRRFDLRNAVSALDRPGSVASWDVATASVDGRVCAIRKSDAAIGMPLRSFAGRRPRTAGLRSRSRWSSRNT